MAFPFHFRTYQITSSVQENWFLYYWPCSFKYASKSHRKVLRILITKGYQYNNAPSQKSKPNINASESQLKAQVLQGCSPQDSCKSSTFQCIRTGAKWTKKPYQIILSIFGSIENSFNEYCGWIWSMKQDITSLQHYFHENNHMKSYHKNIWLTISILVKVRYSNWQL